MFYLCTVFPQSNYVYLFFSENYILTDKKEALQLVKKYAGSRFKIFQSRELAEEYTSQSGDLIPVSPKVETLAKVMTIICKTVIIICLVQIFAH